jgi:D-alanine-D-alanine ligase
MNRKTRIGILFGGRSAEHEVSLQSARNVIDAIDSEKYETVLIGIDRAGAWFLNEDSIALLNSDDPRLISLNKSNLPVSLVPGDQAGVLVDLRGGANLPAIDLLFPVLHGPYGEDGSVQGLAKLANVPCVGSDILGSAIAMDKDVSKRLLRDAGIPVSRHICLRRNGLTKKIRDQLQQDFGFPLYVKPANMGSSVGVAKVPAADELDAAVDSALQYDTKVVIEEAIVGREIECSILGNDAPLASAIGEIGTADGFYSYEAKYIDDNAAELIIPASLEPAVEQRVREMAIHAFQVLECRGMARVDMFLTAANEIFVNEINTIPGFTAISMYPKLWQTSGMSYTDLIDRLIQLALEEHDAKSQLTTTGY